MHILSLILAQVGHTDPWWATIVVSLVNVAISTWNARRLTKVRDHQKEVAEKLSANQQDREEVKK